MLKYFTRWYLVVVKMMLKKSTGKERRIIKLISASEAKLAIPRIATKAGKFFLRVYEAAVSPENQFGIYFSDWYEGRTEYFVISHLNEDQNIELILRAGKQFTFVGDFSSLEIGLNHRSQRWYRRWKARTPTSEEELIKLVDTDTQVKIFPRWMGGALTISNGGDYFSSKIYSVAQMLMRNIQSDYDLKCLL